jgi:dihydroorotase
MLLLARETGARVHFCRLSTADGVDMVRKAKVIGLNVTCDVSVNHVHLSEMDIAYFDSNSRLVPPLRSLRDRDALRQGLADGAIDAICSDHSPVDDDAKQLPFGESQAGATGVELLLPLTLQWAKESNVGLAAALARVTSAAAAILRVPGGTVSVGAAADLCVFDPDVSWTVEPQSLRSQGKNTPFAGHQLKGRVLQTLVDGHIVYESAI